MSTPTQLRPLSPLHRWLALGLTSFICFAQYYVYDSITPLQPLIVQQLHFSSADFGLLYSFYALANICLLLLLAGLIVDRFGLKASGIVYGFLCFLGAALTAVGSSDDLPRLLGGTHDWLATAFLPGWSPALKIMLLGRMIYGVGAEAILVVNNKVLARWFKGKELAFAYGINLTIMRLGTYLADNLQAPLQPRFEAPETATGLIAILSRATGWVLFQVQRAVETVLECTWDLHTALWFAAGVMAVGFVSFFGYILLERAAHGREGAPAQEAAAIAKPEERFVLREAFSFGAPFWYISLLCVAFYSSVFAFHSFAPGILVQRFGYPAAVAGNYTSYMILGTMIFTPIFGWLVDHRGRRATLMILGSFLLIPSYLLIGFTHVHPVLPVFVVGIALSLVPAALWAAIPMMVPEKRLGTAFGVVGWVQNLGLFLFPLVAGKLADARTTTSPTGMVVVDYSATILLFAGLGAFGLVAAVLLKWADARRRDGTSIEKVLLT